MTVTFVNPVAECLVPVNPYRLSINLHNSVVLGLVINKIVDCDQFMLEVGNALQKSRPNISIKSYKTETITFASEELMDRVAKECDGAVCAIGHCGSCTAGTVKDAIAQVERGRPAVSLITELFWLQASALARSLGWPDVPQVNVPYPMWGTDKDYMSTVAEDISDSIIERLEGCDAPTS